MNIVEWERARYERANEILSRRALPPYYAFRQDRARVFAQVIAILDRQVPK